MKKIYIYIIIFIFVFVLRDNICFFYGNILSIFKFNNNYYEAIIKEKDDKIRYLQEEYKSLNNFSNELYLLSYNYKVSKVIFKKIYNTNEFLIQYGKKDKIKNGLGISNELGFIGKITKLNDKTSEVTTIKKLKNIGIQVNNVYGKLNYDEKDNNFYIEDISNYDEININDEVYTSGYGTIKEKIFIGKIIEIKNDIYKKRVIMKSNVDFDNLNYLLIIGDI